MTREDLVALKRRVWPPAAVRPVRAYAVLDSARDPEVYALVRRSYRKSACLFAGALDAELEQAAPFLLELEPKDSLTDELLLRGWRDAWMVLIRSESSFAALRKHLRTLLRVRTEDGRFLLFRFYDPRVLSVYLPTCTGEELQQLFGEHVAEWFAAETQRGETAGFGLVNGRLERRVLDHVAQ